MELELAPLDDDPFEEPIDLVDQILQDNRESPSLQAVRTQAGRDDSDFTLEDGLLLYTGRLVVSSATLRTRLIQEVHNQISTAHPGRDKTYKLLRPRYY